MTPNPKTMKFVADRLLVDDGAIVEYLNIGEAKGSSMLAEKLFSFPFVQAVFVMNNFITITKTENIEWDMVSTELREFIQRYLMENKVVIEKMPEPVASDTSHSSAMQVSDPSEYDAEIKHLLDEFVKPAVESDGGAIDFKSFDQGVVTVSLRGACSGCPSSTVTLKNGIENLLKTKIPAVKEVVAESL
ncbi:MAG: NifU family protein [Flavobacteriales bacterium]|nr:NifU family protein [Flavobacteriales bacterium]